MFAVRGTKTKSSMRSLPLIPQLEDYLLSLWDVQAQNRAIMGEGYSKQYTEYICVDAIGNLLNPDYVTDRFRQELKKTQVAPY